MLPLPSEYLIESYAFAASLNYQFTLVAIVSGAVSKVRHRANIGPCSVLAGMSATPLIILPGWRVRQSRLEAGAMIGR
jgi:hypothetical protein